MSSNIKARAKFRVTAVSGGDSAKSVTLQPMSHEGVSAEEAFAEGDPVGEIQVEISNPSVIGLFTEGREFYVDLTPLY